MQHSMIDVIEEIERVLNEPLNTDSPNVLMSQIAKAEAYSHILVSMLVSVEDGIAKTEQELAEKKASIVDKYKAEKNDVMNIKIEGEISEEMTQLSLRKSRANKYKSLIKIIDRRCSLGQSILSNVTASIKAGINL